MGDMLRELGQAQAARDAYEAARDAYEKVLALELAKDESQARYRLLSITYGRLGDVQLALGDKGAAGRRTRRGWPWPWRQPKTRAMPRHRGSSRSPTEV